MNQGAKGEEARAPVLPFPALVLRGADARLDQSNAKVCAVVVSVVTQGPGVLNLMEVVTEESKPFSLL